MNNLKGKTVLITGAARGMGKAVAKSFADKGVNLILSDILPELENLASELGKTVKVEYAIGDISTPELNEKLVELAMNKHGRLDFVFNNAGIGGQYGSIADLDKQNWDKVLGVNLNAIAFGMKYQVPAMIKSGGGSIVNNASVLGLRASEHSGFAYITSKHAVIGLTKQVAAVHGVDGIRCNAICPGFIDTPLIQNNDLSHFINHTALKRLGNVSEIAEVVVSICSDKFSFVHGAIIPIDGGYILQ